MCNPSTTLSVNMSDVELQLSDVLNLSFGVLHTYTTCSSIIGFDCMLPILNWTKVCGCVCVHVFKTVYEQNSEISLRWHMSYLTNSYKQNCDCTNNVFTYNCICHCNWWMVPQKWLFLGSISIFVVSGPRFHRCPRTLTSTDPQIWDGTTLILVSGVALMMTATHVTQGTRVFHILLSNSLPLRVPDYVLQSVSITANTITISQRFLRRRRGYDMDVNLWVCYTRQS